jgi:hypothetical protein
MTRIRFWQPAGMYAVPGKGEFPQQFAPHAFDAVIGQPVPVRDRPGGRVISTGIVIAAEVDEDGGGVTFEVDLPDGPAPPPHGHEPGSFSFRVPDGEDLPRDPLAVRPPQVIWPAAPEESR